jgi:hypothetical protein
MFNLYEGCMLRYGLFLSLTGVSLSGGEASNILTWISFNRINSGSPAIKVLGPPSVRLPR